MIEKVSWDVFKNLVNLKKVSIVENQLDRKYLLVISDGQLSFCTELSLDANDVKTADYIANFQSGALQNSNLSQSFQIPIVATRKEERDFNTIVSHNFCDNATWVNGTTDSSWEIQPNTGKRLALSRSEIQFKHDLDLTNNQVKLDYYAWVGAGQQAVVQTITFNTVENIFELGNAHYESSLFNGLTTVQFNQEYQLVLYGSETVGELSRVHVYSDQHNEVTGSYVTASFVTEERDI